MWINKNFVPPASLIAGLSLHPLLMLLPVKMGYLRLKKRPGFFRVCDRAWMVMVLLPVLVLFNKKADGQAKVGCNEITVDMGYTIRSVTIKGRWVPAALQRNIEAMVGVGQAFDPAKVATAQEMVRTEIIKGEELYVVRLIGSTSVLFITSDICDVSDETHPKQAGIVIKPFYLRIDLYNIGDNILPVPRTAKPTFYTKVPGLLLAAAPLFALTSDRQYGPSANLQTNTDLLHLPGALQSDKDSKKMNLFLQLGARKSISNLFNEWGAGLQLNHPVYTDTGTGWNIGFRYTSAIQPLGKSDYRFEHLKFLAGISGNGRSVFLNKYALGGAVSFMQNRFDVAPNARSTNRENRYQFHALGDGHAGHGFNRMGIWFNAGVPHSNSGLKSYQQLAGRLGYSVTLGQTHNNVDLEINGGLGYTWGTAPAYNQFYVGNERSGFLYSNLKSEQLQTFPGGPVIRSLGEQEGGFNTSSGLVSGGSSYWHLNLNFSVPIARWSSPLIPDIVIDEETGSTARRKIKGQVNFAKSLIQIDLVDNHGFSEEAADSAAERIIAKDIRPAINYLADRANVYSIKPVLYFDLAQLNKHGLENKLWGAAGAGLQLNIVNAKLDLGYMQTLFPFSDKSKGNFLLRFTVQDFY